MSESLLYIFILTLGVLVHFHLKEDAQKKITRNTKETFYELKVHLLYKIALGGSLAIESVLFLTMIMGMIGGDQTMVINALKLIAFFGVFALPLFLYVFQHKLLFDERSINYRRINGKIIHIQWEEVTEVSYHRRLVLGNLLCVTGKQGQKIGVDENLVGFVSLLDMMEKKTRWNRNDIGIW